MRTGSAAGKAYEKAVKLHRQGQLQDAAQAYRDALLTRPDHFGALHYLGAIEARQGRFQEAITLLRQAIALKPRSAAAHNDLGIALAAFGKPDDAVAQYRLAIAIDPNHVEALNNLGVALLAADRPGQAVVYFVTALARNSKTAELNNNLGNAYIAMARQELAALREETDFACDVSAVPSVRKLIHLAIAQYEKALTVKPAFAEAHHNIANALAVSKRLDEAIVHFRQSLDLEPKSGDAWNDLGRAFVALERNDEAAACFQTALKLKPDFAEVSNNLGFALAAANRHSEAVAHYRKALTLRPDLAEAHVNLGNVLTALEQTEEAIECYTNALACDSNFAAAHGGLGHTYRTLGRRADSIGSFERAVALAPRRAEYYYSLAQAKPLGLNDPHVESMKALARDMGSLGELEQMALHYALGTVYADADEHEQAFHHLAAGNAIRRKRTPYNETAELASFDRISSAFTPEIIRGKSAHGYPSDVPVFVVGMPRSGTTLVEQMLASHPEVFGAGELPDLGRVVKEIWRRNRHRLPFPDALSSIGAAQLSELGTRYVTSIRASAPAAKRIVDKMPSNFKYIGLIHLALPNARIIHICRNPIDTCWSCFAHMFRWVEWSNDLAELGRFYEAYAALMEHWRRVLPPGAMLEVQYETLVADFERQARRIVAHCGLEWDERCLAFHETKRPVRTVSAFQVRRPIYTSSIGRGRAYERWLEPLLEAIGPARQIKAAFSP